MKQPRLKDLVKQAEALTVAAASDERLEKRAALARSLVPVCMLRDIKSRRQNDRGFDAQLAALLAIVRPYIEARVPVPMGEILLDARYGIYPQSASAGHLNPEVMHYPGWVRVRTLAHLFYLDALSPLQNVAYHVIDDLIAATVCVLQLEFGPLRMLEGDPQDPEEALRTLKAKAHAASEEATRNYGRRKDVPFACPDLHLWRYYLACEARQNGYDNADDLSRLSEWLTPSLLKIPKWWRPH